MSAIRRRFHHLLPGLLACWAGLSVGVAVSQDEAVLRVDPPAEEPTWSTNGEFVPVSDLVPLDSQPLDLEVSEGEMTPPLETEAIPTTQSTADLSGSPRVDSGIRQPVVRTPYIEGHSSPTGNTDTDLTMEGDDSVGLPDEGNYYLPSFEGWNLFQMEGLKFRLGPVHGRVELRAGAEYNTNIYATSTNPTPDWVGNITPTLQLGTGGWRGEATNFALLRFSPSFRNYLRNPERDTVNLNLDFTMDWTFSRYQTSAEIRFLRSDQPNATQRGLQEYSELRANWNNSYALGAKTFARLNFGYLFQGYANRDDYSTYSVAPQLAYQFSPKITVFSGPYAGIAFIGEGSYQTFQGLTVGVTYSDLRKWTGQFIAGVQARQFRGDNFAENQDFVTPIFDLAVSYQARETTSFTLGLARDVQITNLERGLTYVNNELRLGWKQNLLGRLDFGLNLNYQLLQYEGEGPDGRTDQFISVTPSLGYTFWRDSITWSIYYRRKQLTSEISTRGYEVNAYGTSLNFRF